ncbi:MAG: DUF2513 domain-containing protein [Phascolarctobacterium sp.]|uniref:DUF2513 domain-containing protein n=1 Tax=Phascolarctobacterium sp. TaxID=2049039 RepID=UPI0026DC2077|nr:DUF2513 domain-containing protein [Phascolarctobacterium sp.]MDO4920960.1 DUF2513 domain-containing protein [Phascolarctobacterium sp.]
MRTNYELCRKILIAIADADIHTDVSNYNICQEEHPDIIGWHIGKLIAEGYVTAIDARSKDGQFDYICVELTPSGERFLNSIENNNRWTKAKQYLQDNALEISFRAIEIAVKRFC